ncbi:ferredoxin--NADP reductase [Actinocorallia aurea]
MTPPTVRTLRVIDVVEETADACSLVLEVPGKLREEFAYRPGQFLTLRVPGAEGAGSARCYSLASAPGLDTDLKVTVKRVAGGFGSNRICDEVRPGSTIDVLPPGGVFGPTTLESDLLLFAGGSGITPVISVIKAVLARPRGTAVLVYANRDESSVIFAEELRDLVRAHPERLQVVHVLESVQGLPTVEFLSGLAAPHVSRDETLICGPEPFMEAAALALTALGVPKEKIVTEKFTSLQGDPFAEPEPLPGEAGSGPATRLAVTLNGNVHEFAWPAQTKLLDLLLAQGLRAPYSCGEGHCAACSCQVVSGEVKMLVNDILEDEDLEEGWVLGCQAVPVTDSVEISFD